MIIDMVELLGFPAEVVCPWCPAVHPSGFAAYDTETREKTLDLPKYFRVEHVCSQCGIPFRVQCSTGVDTDVCSDGTDPRVRAAHEAAGARRQQGGG